MAKKKKGLLPRIEIIIILIFFLSFILWAMSKCNARKVLNEQTALEEDSLSEDSIQEYTITPKPLPQKEGMVQKDVTTVKDEAAATRLYITIDGLKLRTGPSLDSTVIYKFSLFEEVNFLNEVTDSTFQLSLGKEMADEPWVKVKNKRGKIGWVYGAGVNYYKKKREGVQ